MPFVNEACAGRLTAAGFSNFGKWVGKTLGLAPLRMMLAGSKAEILPSVLEDAVHRTAMIRDAVRSVIPEVARWDQPTRQRVTQLFDQFSKGTPEAFEQAVLAEIPTAGPGLTQLRALFDSIFREYVEDGALKEGKRIANYFPVVRDILEARLPGELRIESGTAGQSIAEGVQIHKMNYDEGYISKWYEDMVKSRKPFFTERRKLDPSEDLAQRLSFDDRLNIYITQYARHRALKESMPKIQEVLGQVPEDMRGYVADHMNFWLGRTKPTESALDPVLQGVRDLNFLRTMGFNVLSPIVNTMQRLNTFAVVRPSAFAQAFADVRDPTRLKIAAEAGILGSDHLDKLDAAGATGAFMSKLKEAAGKMFSISEQGNRTHAFMAGLREAEAQGLTGEKAVTMAKQVMYDTQFIQSKSNTPSAFQSEFGRTFGQFQTFRLNQTHFMLRLADQAIQGVKTGDVRSLAPFLKYFGVTVGLGGPAAVLPSYIADEQNTRDTFKKMANVPGALELLFGVGMTNQLGLGAVGMDDASSLLYYAPGPTVGYIQAIMSAMTGKDMGHGLDTTKMGQDLTPQQRVSAIASSIPLAGVQINRVIRTLRVFQADGELRQSLDWGEAMGRTPSSGPLISARIMTLSEMLGQAAGFPPAWQHQEIAQQKRRTEMRDSFQKVEAKAADFLLMGRMAEAQAEIARFAHKYEADFPEGMPIPMPGEAGIKAAAQRHIMAPNAPGRLRPPGILGQAAPFKPLPPRLNPMDFFGTESQ